MPSWWRSWRPSQFVAQSPGNRTVPLPIPAPASSGFTTSTTLPLYWCRYGRRGAPRLLVLHGGPGAHHDYLLPQMLHLAEEHELVFYDQRGGGKSKADARDPVTWRTQVEDLDAIIAELDLGDVPMVGYSWGGLLALLHALDGAARTPAPLALIDPAPLTRHFRAEFEAEFARRQAGSEVLALRTELAASGLRERDSEAYRQRAFELGVAGYFADPDNARNLTPFRVTGRVQQSIWDSLGDFDVVSRLGELRSRAAHTLFVHGREDPIPLASSAAGAAAMGAELLVLERCGHVPYVEQPEALFAGLDPFLARLRDGATSFSTE